MQEKINVSDSVGAVVQKADGSIITTDPSAQEAPQEQKEAFPLIELDVKLKIAQPIKVFLDAQISKMNLDPSKVYSSLVQDAFKLHFHRMCPYCGDSKLAWLAEEKHKKDLAKKIQHLKEKRIKKMQKAARKRNRGN